MGADPATLTLIATIGGTVLSAGSQMSALSDQEAAANASANFRQMQNRLQQDREMTQAALEASQREARLARALARQRAAFGGVVDVGSGSPLRLQEATTGAVNREQRLADLATGQRIANLNSDSAQIEIGREASVHSIKAQRQNVLFDTGLSLANTARKYAGQNTGSYNPAVAPPPRKPTLIR